MCTKHSSRYGEYSGTQNAEGPSSWILCSIKQASLTHLALPNDNVMVIHPLESHSSGSPRLDLDEIEVGDGMGEWEVPWHQNKEEQPLKCK